MEKKRFGDRQGTAAEQLRAEMEAKAVDAVLSGTHWLAAQTVGTRSSQEVARDMAGAWRQVGKVFAIEWEGEILYPSYVFDLLREPIPEVREILKVFRGYRPVRIASWFESTNGMLDGKRHREILASAPSAVLEAARDHVEGAAHG